MTIERSHPLTGREAFALWAPLAATWVMMSVEGPFVAAVIARLADPTPNLAAYGVAFTFAWIFESPIIMMMSAATALVRDRDAFAKLRRFAYALNALATGLMLAGLVPPVFRFVTEDLIGLPSEVARLTHAASLVLVPWPAAIGYRRFYQGVMVRHGFPRGVAYGTVIRLSAMTATALVARLVPGLPGATVGSVALVSGVVAEAAAARLMARGVVGRILADRTPLPPPGDRLTTRGILHFYYPLALTSIIGLAVNPTLTFFLGRSRLPLESLAVFPVVVSFTFVFRSLGIAMQEATIALVGERRENLPVLRRFGVLVGSASSGLLAVIAFSPLADLWFAGVAGLSADLARIAKVPLRLLWLAPALEVLMALERSLLVHARRTRWVTAATIVEVAVIVTTLWAGIAWLGLVGATAAAASLTIGRLTANLFLYPQTLGRY